MSKLQNVVSLSTIEAENMVASHACKEAIWLKDLLGEFGRMQNNVKVFCDNQSFIQLASNPAYHSKKKVLFIWQVMQLITVRKNIFLLSTIL